MHRTHSNFAKRVHPQNTFAIMRELTKGSVFILMLIKTFHYKNNWEGILILIFWHYIFSKKDLEFNSMWWVYAHNKFKLGLFVISSKLFSTLAVRSAWSVKAFALFVPASTADWCSDAWAVLIWIISALSRPSSSATAEIFWFMASIAGAWNIRCLLMSGRESWAAPLPRLQSCKCGSAQW